MTPTPAEVEVMMKGLQDLGKRISELEQVIAKMSEHDTEILKSDVVRDAKACAVESMLYDLATRAGIAPDSLRKHYEIRFQWWHNYLLHGSEDGLGSTANLERQSVADVSVPQDYPSLFDPPTRGKS